MCQHGATERGYNVNEMQNDAMQSQSNSTQMATSRAFLRGPRLGVTRFIPGAPGNLGEPQSSREHQGTPGESQGAPGSPWGTMTYEKTKFLSPGLCPDESQSSWPADQLASRPAGQLGSWPVDDGPPKDAVETKPAYGLAAKVWMDGFA